MGNLNDSFLNIIDSGEADVLRRKLLIERGTAIIQTVLNDIRSSRTDNVSFTFTHRLKCLQKRHYVESLRRVNNKEQSQWTFNYSELESLVPTTDIMLYYTSFSSSLSFHFVVKHLSPSATF